MNTNIRNQQTHIAEQFNRADRHLNTRSKRALLKIQSWNLALLPGTDEYFKKQVQELVTESLLTYVSTGYILLQEGYLDGQILN
jgi:hypothetical protein